MRTAYFDCFSGISGDMTLAALLDAGCPLTLFEETIASLQLPGVAIRFERVARHGIAAARVHVDTPPVEGHRHRHLPKILRIIESAGLPAPVAERAARVFQRLAEAEAAVHQTTVEKVHFHEVGADDAIVDIVCACVGLHALGVERVVSSPVPVGSGTVRCEHGLMPVPAPATARLLRGVPLAACDEPGELTTPTGAALIAELAAGFGPLPAMTLEAIGVGTGSREGRTRPNILRVLIGTSIETGAGRSDAAAPGAGAAAAVAGGSAAEADTVAVLETQIDDQTGEALAHAVQRLLDAGALDAYVVPIMMKKGRCGQLLTVVCRPGDAGTLEDALFAHTTTFGVRRREAHRSILARAHETVTTRFGPVRVKIGRRAGRVVQASPEYEDCARLAREHGCALALVQQAARTAWGERHGPADDELRHDSGSG